MLTNPPDNGQRIPRSKKSEGRCNLASKRKPPPSQRPERNPTRRELEDDAAHCLHECVGIINNAYPEGSASGWNPVVVAHIYPKARKPANAPL